MPIQDSSLRRLKLLRNNNQSVYTKLPDELNKNLCKILNEEINLLRRLKPLRQELTNCSGHKIYQLFSLVIEKDTKFITENSLRTFLKRNEHYMLDADVNQVIKRMDKDKDGKVSYPDFLNSLLIHQKGENPDYCQEGRRGFMSPQNAKMQVSMSTPKRKEILKTEQKRQKMLSEKPKEIINEAEIRDRMYRKESASEVDEFEIKRKDRERFEDDGKNIGELNDNKYDANNEILGINYHDKIYQKKISAEKNIDFNRPKPSKSVLNNQQRYIGNETRNCKSNSYMNLDMNEEFNIPPNERNSRPKVLRTDIMTSNDLIERPMGFSRSINEGPKHNPKYNIKRNSPQYVADNDYEDHHEVEHIKNQKKTNVQRPIKDNKNEYYDSKEDTNYKKKADIRKPIEISDNEVHRSVPVRKCAKKSNKDNIGKSPSDINNYEKEQKPKGRPKRINAPKPKNTAESDNIIERKQRPKKSKLKKQSEDDEEYIPESRSNKRTTKTGAKVNTAAKESSGKKKVNRKNREEDINSDEQNYKVQRTNKPKPIKNEMVNRRMATKNPKYNYDNENIDEDEKEYRMEKRKNKESNNNEETLQLSQEYEQEDLINHSSDKDGFFRQQRYTNIYVQHMYITISDRKHYLYMDGVYYSYMLTSCYIT